MVKIIITENLVLKDSVGKDVLELLSQINSKVATVKKETEEAKNLEQLVGNLTQFLELRIVIQDNGLYRLRLYEEIKDFKDVDGNAIYDCNNIGGHRRNCPEIFTIKNGWTLAQMIYYMFSGKFHPKKKEFIEAVKRLKDAKVNGYINEMEKIRTKKGSLKYDLFKTPSYLLGEINSKIEAIKGEMEGFENLKQQVKYLTQILENELKQESVYETAASKKKIPKGGNTNKVKDYSKGDLFIAGWRVPEITGLSKEILAEVIKGILKDSIPYNEIVTGNNGDYKINLRHLVPALDNSGFSAEAMKFRNIHRV